MNVVARTDTPRSPSRRQDDEFPPRDDFSDADQLRVGNDGIFMLAFFSKCVRRRLGRNSAVLALTERFLPPVAFLFNWIGFCLSFCLTNTIAGRYGAICGFGLSLIKWILIVRVRSMRGDILDAFTAGLLTKVPTYEFSRLRRVSTGKYCL